MPIPDDARYGKDCSPQSRKEDVVYEYDVAPESLAKEAERDGWRNKDEFNGQFPPKAVTKGTAEAGNAAADSLKPGRGTESNTDR